MGCTGCSALIDAVVCAIGVLVTVAFVAEAQHAGMAGFTTFAGLAYAGGVA